MIILLLGWNREKSSIPSFAGGIPLFQSLTDFSFNHPGNGLC
jgi:hypothetical protein